jgi:hypothetical protein
VFFKPQRGDMSPFQGLKKAWGDVVMPTNMPLLRSSKPAQFTRIEEKNTIALFEHSSVLLIDIGTTRAAILDGLAWLKTQAQAAPDAIVIVKRRG